MWMDIKALSKIANYKNKDITVANVFELYIFAII